MGRPTSSNPVRLTDPEKTMAPSTLDLFILTFNCAKNLINVGVFASHLFGALSQNAAGLPDLVAFSLQEVAPLSYSFIGSYFLNPYYARYEEALNLASGRILAAEEEADSGETRVPSKPAARPYTLVRAKNVGMTAILLFARDPTAVHKIEEAECGFGAADMGNKGAVGLRVTYGGTDVSEVTLVATHLAAMEWNLRKRNANWRSIMSGLTFANPRALLPGVFPTNAPGSAPTPDRSGAGNTTMPAESSSDSSEAEVEEGDVQPLLLNGTSGSSKTLSSEHQAALRDISIFKPTSHLFVAGDLNYRISSSTPPPLSAFPSFDPTSPHYYPAFLARDQLTQERQAGRAFHGMTEAAVGFGPTYKYNVLASAAGADNEAAVRAGATVNGVPEVPWRFASHRWPGWCDRVLYLDLPESSSSRQTQAIRVRAYDSLPVVRTSDHRPVFLRVCVPLLRADEMRQVQDEEEEAEESRDPRVRPPVSVDAHAWERRAAARRREVLVGWSAFFWSTREGALVMATLLAVLVGVWYLVRVW